MAPALTACQGGGQKGRHRNCVPSPRSHPPSTKNFKFLFSGMMLSTTSSQRSKDRLAKDPKIDYPKIQRSIRQRSKHLLEAPAKLLCRIACVHVLWSRNFHKFLLKDSQFRVQHTVGTPAPRRTQILTIRLGEKTCTGLLWEYHYGR